MANQLRTFSQLQAAVTHVLAGTPNANNPAAAIVNMALNWAANQRPWLWRQRPLGLSVIEQSITAISRGSDQITVTVTAPGHNLIAGLQAQIIGTNNSNTGGVPFNGSYIVVSVIDANNFTVSNAGAAGDYGLVTNTPAAGNVGGFIGGQILLPTDFATLGVLKSAPNSFRDVTATTLDDLLTRRQFAYGSTYELYYAISYIPQASTTSEPLPMIFMFPTPTLPTINFLQGNYYRRIPMLVIGSDVPDVPSHFQDLVYFACRAFAKSTEEDQVGEDWRITNMLLAQFSEEDGMSQSCAGVMKSTLFPRTFPVSQFYPNGRITA